MPEVKTATQIVASIRDVLLIYGNDFLRDGFDDDPVKQRRPSILGFFNRALARYASTGYRPCRWFISARAGASEYSLPGELQAVNSVHYDGRPLEVMAIHAMRERFPNMDDADAPTGTPAFAAIYGDILFLHPAPSESDTGYPQADSTSSISIWGDSVQADLIDRGDVVTRVPIEAVTYLIDITACDIARTLTMRGLLNLEAVLSGMEAARQLADRELSSLARNRDSGARQRLIPATNRRRAGYSRV